MDSLTNYACLASFPDCKRGYVFFMHL